MATQNSNTLLKMNIFCCFERYQSKKQVENHFKKKNDDAKKILKNHTLKWRDMTALNSILITCNSLIQTFAH